MSFFRQTENVHFCLKIHFFSKLMVKEAFSRFGKWRNRFLDQKTMGICSFLIFYNDISSFLKVLRFLPHPVKKGLFYHKIIMLLYNRYGIITMNFIRSYFILD